MEICSVLVSAINQISKLWSQLARESLLDSQRQRILLKRAVESRIARGQMFVIEGNKYHFFRAVVLPFD
jgi:hypothetical protein